MRISDEADCQAAVGILARIGVTANLDARSKAQRFPLLSNLETDFYMLGVGRPGMRFGVRLQLSRPFRGREMRLVERRPIPDVWRCLPVAACE